MEDLPPIPPHLSKMVEGIDKQIEELKQKGPDKILEERSKESGKVAPTLDIKVLELQKLSLAVAQSQNLQHHQLLFAETWNTLLDMTYKKARAENSLKKAQKRIEELEKSD